MTDDLEQNLSAAIAADMQKPISRRSTNGVSVERETSRSAVDQLSLAVEGLLKMEGELARLTEQLVGPYNEETVRKDPAPAEGLPMFDRVRNDARELAELALRIDKRIKYIRDKL